MDQFTHKRTTARPAPARPAPARPAQARRHDERSPSSLRDTAKDILAVPEDKTEVRIQSPYNRCPLYGVALVAAEVHDPEFTIHGPQGCVAAVIEAFALQRNEVEFHTSSMTKEDIIFGGERRLYEALADSFTPYEKAGPKFVITTCSSEIIGDNVKGVTNKFHQDLPTVVVAGGGVNGDHYRGINNALAELTARFADTSVARVPGRVNLIGNVGLSRQWKGDFYEAVRLLEAMGLEVNRLGCDSTIENYRVAGSAELTILLNGEIGAEAARILHDKFDVAPFSSTYYLPLGLRGTEIWLREIAQRMKLPTAPLDAFIEAEETRVRSALKVGLYHMTYIEKLVNLRDMRVAVVAEGAVAFSWARFLSEELEMNPVFVGLRSLTGNTALADTFRTWMRESRRAPRVAPAHTYRDIEEGFLATRPEMIFGSSVDAEVGAADGIRKFLHITHPNTSLVTITDRPFLGYNGVINATETIINMMG